MAAYRRVYDSRHLQTDCQELGSAANPTLGNRIWATFIFYLAVIKWQMKIVNSSRRCGAVGSGIEVAVDAG